MIVFGWKFVYRDQFCAPKLAVTLQEVKHPIIDEKRQKNNYFFHRKLQTNEHIHEMGRRASKMDFS